MRLKLKFYDHAGAPLDLRTWTPRDGVVDIPNGAEQLVVEAVEEDP